MVDSGMNILIIRGKLGLGLVILLSLFLLTGCDNNVVKCPKEKADKASEAFSACLQENGRLSSRNCGEFSARIYCPLFK